MRLVRRNGWIAERRAEWEAQLDRFEEYLFNTEERRD